MFCFGTELVPRTVDFHWYWYRILKFWYRDNPTIYIYIYIYSVIYYIRGGERWSWRATLLLFLICCRLLQTQTALQSLRTCRDPQHFLGHTSRWLQWMTHNRPDVRGVRHMTVCLTVCVLLSESLLFSRTLCAYRKPQCHNLRSLISCTN